jgi:hypothetical protein
MNNLWITALLWAVLLTALHLVHRWQARCEARCRARTSPIVDEWATTVEVVEVLTQRPTTIIAIVKEGNDLKCRGNVDRDSCLAIFEAMVDSMLDDIQKEGRAAQRRRKGK